MRHGIAYPLSAIREAVSTVVGWTIVIAATIVAGFFIGYWIGHGEIKALSTTFMAMLWIPVVWLGRPVVIIAYGVAALAWYLPIRCCESTWLRWAAALVNLLTWIVIIAIEVEQCSQGKFWRW